MYHFVTKWFFRAPFERVWEAAKDVKAYSTWWQGMKRPTIRGLEPKLQLGSVVDCEVKGSLPYTLRFSIEVTAFKSPNMMEIKSSGDLVGGGKWVLEAQAGGTASTFYWDVGTTNPILNILGKIPFVRAMLEKNHDGVMDKGYRVLKSRLEG